MLAVAVIHFNFAGFRTPVRNLHSFLRDMEMRGIPVFGLEYYLPKTPARMTNREGWVSQQVPHRAIMFQKEHMLNRVVMEQIPEKFNNILCCDADIFFSNKNVASDIQTLLTQLKAVQPFEKACWTDSTGGVYKRRWSTGKVPLTAKWDSHPGFCWAMRRDFWTRGPGLYPYGIAGGGDMVTSLGLTGMPEFSSVTGNLCGNQFESGVYADYHKKAFEWSEGKVGWCPGNAYHMYHGDRKDRGYSARGALLEGVDITTDLIVRNGVMQWSDHVPDSLPDSLLEYFKSRLEDD